MQLILQRSNFSKSLLQSMSLALFTSFITLTAGCGGQAKLESISLSPEPTELPMGVSQQYKAIGHYSNGDDDEIKPTSWTSSEAAIAIVNETGLVTAQRVGSTNLTVIAGDVVQRIPITVSNTVIKSIGVTPDSPTAAIGSTLQLTATGTYTDGSTREHMTLIPSGYVDYVFMPASTWQSSNEEVATVNASGVVTLHKAGTAKITASIDKVVGSATVTASTTTANPTSESTTAAATAAQKVEAQL